MHPTTQGPKGGTSNPPWDRRPSLTVNPERNRVHCFVCNRGADPIAWLQDRQGLSFREALEELARRYGIPLPEEDPEAAARAEADRRERQWLREWRSRQEEQFHRPCWLNSRLPVPPDRGESRGRKQWEICPSPGFHQSQGTRCISGAS
jgi:hypothetical protein